MITMLRKCTTRTKGTSTCSKNISYSSMMIHGNFHNNHSSYHDHQQFHQTFQTMPLRMAAPSTSIASSSSPSSSLLLSTFTNTRMIEKQKTHIPYSYFFLHTAAHTTSTPTRTTTTGGGSSSSSTIMLRNFASKKEDANESNETNNNNDNNDIKEEEENDKTMKQQNESFEDTIHRLKGDGTGTSSSSSSSSSSSNAQQQQQDILHTLSNYYTSFTTSLSETWTELLNSNQAKDINKKIMDIHASKPGNVKDDDNEAADKYQGTMELMIVEKDKEQLSAYERIQRRLSEAPLIQDIFKRAEDIYEKSGAPQAREKISHITEDAREAWETSQNPWVYRVSSVYDTLTAESETAMAERELRILDPHFSLEGWKRDLVEVTLPNIMTLFLQGRIKELKPFLGEAVYNRMAAEARARKKEGVYIDTNVLGIMNSDILNIMPDTVNKGAPIITIHFMCQQINCVRKKETGEITEGSEDDIRAYSYVVAMQREYDEEKGELNWKILDFMLNGAIAYL